MTDAGHAGGCQCGAVRYRIGELGRATICHCRMCQKAFGAFYGPLVTVQDFTWTRGEPAWFQSSNKVRRGFCGECGTPLAYDHGGDTPEIAIGTLDDPAAAAPTRQLNPADKLAFVDGLQELPMRGPDYNPKAAAFMADIESRQHPDHETDDWPPEKKT